MSTIMETYQRESSVGTRFTVEDLIVRDSLRAIDAYATLGLYRLVINGGIAAQLYVHPNFPNLRRPTHDVDLISNRRPNAETFRNDIGKNLAKLLEQYCPEIDIIRTVHEVRVKDFDGYPFYIHLYKWTVNGFEREKRNLERQVANANQLRVPYSDASVLVVRPEDLLVGKVKRLKKINEDRKLPKESSDTYQKVIQRDLVSLTDQDFNQWLASLIHRKNMLPAFYDRGEEEFRRELDFYRASKDLFDIALTAKLATERKIDFDERYYDQIIQGIE